MVTIAGIGDVSVVSVALGIFAGAAVAAVFWWRLRQRATTSAAALRASIASLDDPQGEDATSSLTAADRVVLETLAGVTRSLQSKVARLQNERDVMLSRVGDGVIVTDVHGIVVLVNRTQLDRLHLPEQRVVGRSLIEVLHDHEVDELVRRSLSSGSEQTATVEIGPGRRLMQVSAITLGPGAGRVVVLQDRTEIRRLERVRREFVANISHELRTPLTTLKLLSETLLLDDAAAPEVLKDYLGRIEVEVDRLAQMVDELGELSLIETGQVKLQQVLLQVGPLIHAAVERLEAQAARSGLKVAVDVSGDLPDVYGDERRLEQVMLNLLHNAVKFTPEGGSLRVFAAESEGGVTVSVQDSGVGVAEEDLERIFERFYKSDRSRSSTGTGLGLAIARHIVELHGGRIRAESVEGQGSTFSFTLPIAAGGEPPLVQGVVGGS
ncbi:MAG: PAS domain-containing protein [Dehalococcoidia bacterium]|nr:MAG: PAS domain-containing protein [Dehalococcoidia bacterium]